MLKVVTDGSTVTLPDYTWWVLIWQPPVITVKNLSAGAITVQVTNGHIDTTLTSVSVSPGDAMDFQADLASSGWIQS